MKKHTCLMVALITGALLLGLGAAQGLAAPKKDNGQSLHRDGTAFVKESRITQAQRQAAADRAKAKGFKAPALELGAPVEANGAPAIQPEPKGKGAKK